MANSQDLSALRAGVSAWNAWRSDHGDAYLDLSDIDLTARDFPHSSGGVDDPYDAYLERIVFRRTNLARTRIIGMYIKDADFSDANLKEADLKHSRFVHVNFDRANLSGADLRGTELVESDISDAILEGARLEGATIDGRSLEAVREAQRDAL